MRGEIVQRAGRAGLLEIFAAGHHHQLRIFEVPRNQRGVGLGAHTHGHVVALFHEIDVAVAQVHVQPDVGKAFSKQRQQRQQAVVAVRGGHADAQCAGRLRLLAHDLALGFGELRQCLAALREVGAARVSEPHAARGAHEEAQAQALFEPRDRAAHRRRRHACGQRGRGEAAGFRRQAKEFDAAEKDVAELPLHGLITSRIK